MVGSNAAAARVSAALRAELVTLGRVAPTGVALGRDGWQGVVAGVGDLVQARRNGWELAGYAGNTRPPINRETYRVTALRADGGLTVAPVTGRAAQNGDGAGRGAGDAAGSCPACYVAADLTLAYASTVHAAEGRTVDTSHSVIGARTDLRRAAGADDPRPGGQHRVGHHPRRRPRRRRPGRPSTWCSGPRGRCSPTCWRPREQELSALAEQERAEVEARSTMTHVDQLIAVAEQVTTGRTSADAGPARRRRPAHPRRARRTWPPTTRCGRWSGCCAPPSWPATTPTPSSTRAVSARDFRDARSLAQVLHHRISKRPHRPAHPARHLARPT